MGLCCAALCYNSIRTIKGLSDEIHIVVKQSLASIENVLPLLLKRRLLSRKAIIPNVIVDKKPTNNKNKQHKCDVCHTAEATTTTAMTTASKANLVADNVLGLNKKSTDLSNITGSVAVNNQELNKIVAVEGNNAGSVTATVTANDCCCPSNVNVNVNTNTNSNTPNICLIRRYDDDGYCCYCNNQSPSAITIENIIDELQLVFENKYWVVQCKYCDLISKLDFQIINMIYGCDQGHLYEVCAMWF